jgi:hypothetical protein
MMLPYTKLVFVDRSWPLFDVRRNGTELGKKKRETLEELGRGIPRPNSWA